MWPIAYGRTLQKESWIESMLLYKREMANNSTPKSRDARVYLPKNNNIYCPWCNFIMFTGALRWLCVHAQHYMKTFLLMMMYIESRSFSSNSDSWIISSCCIHSRNIDCDYIWGRLCLWASVFCMKEMLKFSSSHNGWTLKESKNTVLSTL